MMFLARVVCSVFAMLFALDLAAFSVVCWLLAFGFRDSDTSTYIIIPAGIAFTLSAITFVCISIYLLFCRLKPGEDDARSSKPSILQRSVGSVICATAGVFIGLVLALVVGAQFDDRIAAFIAFNLTICAAALVGFVYPERTTAEAMGVIDGFKEMLAKVLEILGV